MSEATTPNQDVAIGMCAIGGATHTGCQNVAIGVDALKESTSAKRNIVIGVALFLLMHVDL